MFEAEQSILIEWYECSDKCWIFQLRINQTLLCTYFMCYVSEETVSLNKMQICAIPIRGKDSAATSAKSAKNLADVIIAHLTENTSNKINNYYISSEY